MMLIDCPYCGPRNEDEFYCAGQAHVDRPTDPAATDAAEWGAYLFARANTRGLYAERWCHRFGCEQWFNLARDTRDHSGKLSYEMGARSVPRTDGDL
jgi:heterotetrameric sarcosine oxidase delta subunit